LAFPAKGERRIETIHLRHLEIKHNDIRPDLSEPLHRFFAIAGFITDTPTLVLLQHTADRAPDIRVVVHY
jgi:hypothetical protein